MTAEFVSSTRVAALVSVDVLPPGVLPDVEPDVPLPDVVPESPPVDVLPPDVLPELEPDVPQPDVEPVSPADAVAPVKSTRNVSIRVVHPHAVSRPRVLSQVLENSAHLPSLEICANPWP